MVFVVYYWAGHVLESVANCSIYGGNGNCMRKCMWKTGAEEVTWEAWVLVIE